MWYLTFELYHILAIISRVLAKCFITCRGGHNLIQNGRQTKLNQTENFQLNYLLLTMGGIHKISLPNMTILFSTKQSVCFSAYNVICMLRMNQVTQVKINSSFDFDQPRKICLVEVHREYKYAFRFETEYCFHPILLALC